MIEEKLENLSDKQIKEDKGNEKSSIDNIMKSCLIGSGLLVTVGFLSTAGIFIKDNLNYTPTTTPEIVIAYRTIETQLKTDCYDYGRGTFKGNIQQISGLINQLEKIENSERYNTYLNEQTEFRKANPVKINPLLKYSALLFGIGVFGICGCAFYFAVREDKKRHEVGLNETGKYIK